MNILVLNGSPHSQGTTARMVQSFTDGARKKGHHATVKAICQKNIHGCLACEYCHTKSERCCIQKDDMQEIYPLLDEAEMLVLASPVYYHSFSGQLQCAINRIYALDKPAHLKRAALFLSSGDEDVYDGAIYAYQKSFLEYLELKNEGIFRISEKRCKDDPDALTKLLQTLYLFGQSLQEHGGKTE